MMSGQGGPGSPGMDTSQGGGGGPAHGRSRKDVIAKAVFDWFDKGDDAKTPYVYNAVPDTLEIAVDGEFRCADLAEHIQKRLIEVGL